LEKYFGDNFINSPFSLLKGIDLRSLLKIYNSENYKFISEKYYKQLINLFYRLGYDFVPYHDFIFSYWGLFNNQMLNTKDTALLSRGERAWAQEGYGRIKTWEDFYNYPWKQADYVINMSEHLLLSMSKNLPAGMKIGVMAVMFENALEFLLGFQGLFLGIYDYPELVKAVLDELGKIVLKYYTLVYQMDSVGFIIHGDDLGYKTSTILSTEHLKKLIFPWFKKYSSVAHKYKKSFWLHSCGNKNDIMEELINDVGIDGLHSFQDNCCPIIEYKHKYGDKIILLGGLDMDKLIRSDEISLRKYIRHILTNCQVNGMYAFGTGNTVCNYLPVENYIIMRQEEYSWYF